MNILVTDEDEQLHKFRSELGKYTNTQEVINTALKVIEENLHRPADINQKITIEDEDVCYRTFGDRSMAEGCDYTKDYIDCELVEK
ncbi:hypothetical protein LC593_27355 [Nostoc sp. CHAB 5844]|nr:hypothetical protein [Nostoc sp. CHAB 5844]